MKKQTAEAARLRLELTPSLQRSGMDLGSKKGASSWLMTLPIREHNFALPKDMQFAYDTDGNHHACHLTVSVERTYPYSMLSAAHVVDSQLQSC